MPEKNIIIVAEMCESWLWIGQSATSFMCDILFVAERLDFWGLCHLAYNIFSNTARYGVFTGMANSCTRLTCLD